MAVKEALPDTAVLRKDFLVRREDIDVTWRAGADAVLLIASILTGDELADLKAYAERLGLAVFLEVHDRADCVKASPLRPAYTGINCRDLTDFSIDRAIPVNTKAFVDWPTRLVFESGISRPEEASWAGAAGFQGRARRRGRREGPDPGPAADRVVPARGFAPPPTRTRAFGPSSMAGKIDRPLVKICGLAHYDDVVLADDLGADLVGSFFATSKRQVNPAFVRHAPKTRALKVGVVQLDGGDLVPDDIAALVGRRPARRAAVPRPGGPLAGRRLGRPRLQGSRHRRPRLVEAVALRRAAAPVGRRGFRRLGTTRRRRRAGGAGGFGVRRPAAVAGGRA